MPSIMVEGLEVGTTKAVVAATCGAALALPLFLSWFRHRRRRLDDALPYPDGPPGHWLMGNALDLPDVRKGYHIDPKFLEWSKQYGLYFTIRLPVVGRMLVVADPDLARHITVTRNHVFPKSFTYENFTPLFGDKGIVILEGKEWQDARRTFNPGFVPSFLKSVVTVLAEKLNRFVDCIDEDIQAGTATKTLVRSQTFTSDVIVSVAFGEDWGGTKPHPARSWTTELAQLTSLVSQDPMVKYCSVKTRRRIKHLQRLLDGEMRDILRRRVDALDNKNRSVCDSKDILSLAIDHMRAEGRRALTKEEEEVIISQLKTFYFAGHDTTATLISWTVWLLSQHGDEHRKLRAELARHRIWEDGAVPTYDQLQKCDYLDAVLKETLRLYPPAGTARYTSDTSETWRDPKSGEEYTIGGAILYVVPYVMGRHPYLWTRPDEFVPSRFLDGSEGDLSGKFLPFMKGPRDCLGKYFAMLEAKVAISRLCLLYDFDCVNSNDEICYMVTSLPRFGAEVRFRRRRAE